MKIPLEWLKEYIKIDLKPEALAERLTMSGLEVAAIEYHGKNISDVVVGKIKGIERHATKPDVLICQVDTGAKILQIVTKAANVKVGDKVPVALHGAKLPSGIKIQKRELHGVESFGMLCSEVELGLSKSAEGILILDRDSAIGEDIRKVLGIGGAVLDIDVLPNRIDVLSITGMAREVGAILNRKVKLPIIKIKEVAEESKNIAKVIVKEGDLCPRYMARVIRKVKIKPSPEWMQEKLTACGMRPINNVVDATNYVLLEMGQPLHAFDINLLSERTIIVRKAKKGERIITIDGEKREVDDTLVIADAEKPVAVAGVMGGANTEVMELTKDILLESAYFEPKSIHRTEKSLKLRTEASIRFDRGVDWDAVESALDRAAVLIAELSGGEILKGKIDIKERERKPRPIKLRLERVNRILGAKLKMPEVKAILARLGLPLKGQTVLVPLFRAGDIEREIDLIEEIARIYGYGKIPTTLPGLKIKSVKDAAEKRISGIKDILVNSGLNEVITYSMEAPNSPQIGQVHGQPIKLLNPISEELSVMRGSILPNLLQVLSYNLNRQIEDVNIFEVGKVFYKEDKKDFAEKQVLAAVLFGSRAYRYEGGKQATDFFQVKRMVEDMMNYLGVSYDIKDNDLSGFHPGKSACLFRGDKLIGIFGELHPDISLKIGADKPVQAFTIDLDEILDMKKLPPKYRDVPVYPATKRDIAMIVPAGVTNSAIIHEIRDSGGDLVEDIVLFDRYEGQQIEKGHFSLAYSIIYRSQNRTLTDEEVNAKHGEISDNLAKKLGVKVRK